MCVCRLMVLLLILLLKTLPVGPKTLPVGLKILPVGLIVSVSNSSQNMFHIYKL